jgi:aspartyl-tRNA(Asn)/glutamyl-tRNA(Gln) amidotransferase subunit A
MQILMPDLSTTRRALRVGLTSADAEMDRAIAVSSSDSCRNAFLKTFGESARTQSRERDMVNRHLAGLPVSVKDLFDLQGQISTAGSIALSHAAPALQDCPAVARLKSAGGVVIGRTNMSEFAFSGVGTNPHYGTPANAAATDVPRIPGGSSSGAAVSVATGAAFIGLGSDTGGSIRIPAALNGIVGFKNTARLVPTEGAIPLSTTLDTVCALTRSVSDAIVAHEVLAARTVTRSDAPLSIYRLAVARTLMLDGLDSTVAAAFQRSLYRLRAAGTVIEEIDLPQLDELATLQATGGFSAAESYAWHRTLLKNHADQYDPRVALRIQRGASMAACDYIDLIHARVDWITRMQAQLQRFDAVLSPAVPIVAPPIAQVAPGAERDEAFFKVNGQLLRNTNVVNMLDGCAISIPCHNPDELPVGLMIWHGALHDDAILNIALQAEKLLQN